MDAFFALPHFPHLLWLAVLTYLRLVCRPASSASVSLAASLLRRHKVVRETGSLVVLSGITLTDGSAGKTIPRARSSADTVITRGAAEVGTVRAPKACGDQIWSVLLCP